MVEEKVVIKTKNENFIEKVLQGYMSHYKFNIH